MFEHFSHFRSLTLSSQPLTTTVKPQLAAVKLSRTFLQLSVPHAHDKRWMFAMMNDPQRQSLNALLRVTQFRQLLLQRRLGERRHADRSLSLQTTLRRHIRLETGLKLMQFYPKTCGSWEKADPNIHYNIIYNV